MEKNIPELSSIYCRCLAKLRVDRPDPEKARDRLAYWSERYNRLVGSVGNTYSCILDAYAWREAYKQYLEEAIK